LTAFANDSGGATVEIDDITFCKEFDDTEADTAAACDETGITDNNAVFVVVRTEARTANYALTPIVAAFSGTIHAEAVAGVQSSICNVAPLMVCVPSDDFPTEDDIGKGLLLKPLDGVSGNYGLLDFGKGTGAVTTALLGFGLNGCQDTDDNQTEPGTKAPVTDAINTRMDVYAQNNNAVWNNNNPKGPVCNTATGAGCPSINSSKDMVLQYTETFKNQTTQPTPTASCAANPKTLNPIPEMVAPTPDVPGFNRDTCFYNANHSCGSGLAGNIGDGSWDRTAYFNRYHGGDMTGAAAFAGKAATDLTRYDVYRWESYNPANLATPPNLPTNQKIVTMTKTPPDKNGKSDYTFVTQCTYSKAVYGSTGYPAQKDRRVLPIVAANCDSLKGKGTAFEDYQILRVFDVFLTEPSQNRTYTDEKEIFAEVVGPAETVGGGAGFQYYTRNKPYLVR
jgi:hypothetical protein